MHAIIPLFIGFVTKIHSYDFVKSSHYVNKIDQNWSKFWRVLPFSIGLGCGFLQIVIILLRTLLLWQWLLCTS